MYKDLMLRAYETASLSPDPSTQTGAVVSDGVNLAWACNAIHSAFPQNYENKYKWITHAESGAIYRAAKAGIVPKIMVTPWAACNRCAISIVESGIETLVLHKQRMDIKSNWDLETPLAFIRNAGVNVLFLDAQFPDAPEIRISQQLWQP